LLPNVDGIFRPRKLAGPAAQASQTLSAESWLLTGVAAEASWLLIEHSDDIVQDQPWRRRDAVPLRLRHRRRDGVGGMGERTGAGSAPRPVPKFEVDVGVAAEQLQHAADGVGMVIVAVATVIDRVFSASVDAALKQAQLSEKLGVVGQPDQASREQRGALQVNFGLGAIALPIGDAVFGPGGADPGRGVVISGYAVGPVILQQLGIFLSHRGGVE
jgi:hypothetical protein